MSKVIIIFIPLFLVIVGCSKSLPTRSPDSYISEVKKLKPELEDVKLNILKPVNKNNLKPAIDNPLVMQGIIPLKVNAEGVLKITFVKVICHLDENGDIIPEDMEVIENTSESSWNPHYLEATKTKFPNDIPQIEGLPYKKYYKWKYVSPDMQYAVLHYVLPVKGFSFSDRDNEGVLALVDRDFNLIQQRHIRVAWTAAVVEWNRDYVVVSHHNKKTSWKLTSMNVENNEDLETDKFFFHKVERGESLWKIAKMYQSNSKLMERIDEIKNLNAEVIGNGLEPGMVLKIPREKLLGKE